MVQGVACLWRERCLCQERHAFLKVSSGRRRRGPSHSEKYDFNAARLLERSGGPSAPQRIRPQHGRVKEQFANAQVPPSSESGDPAAEDRLARRSVESCEREEPARERALEGHHLLLPSPGADLCERQRNDYVVSGPQCDVCEAALKEFPCAKEAAEPDEQPCSKMKPVFGYRDACEREQNL